MEIKSESLNPEVHTDLLFAFDKIVLISPFEFVYEAQLENEEFIGKIRNWLIRVSEIDKVLEVVLFSNSPTSDAVFFSKASTLINRLQAEHKPRLFSEISTFNPAVHSPANPASFVLSEPGFSVPDSLSGCLYADFDTFSPGDEALLEEILNSKIACASFNLSWIKGALHANPAIAEIISGRDTTPVHLPHTRKNAEASPFNWAVLFLIALMGVFVTHYRYHPVFRAEVFRYFTSKKFFIRDILDYRIRSASHGYIIFLESVLAAGLICYFSVPALVSESGLQALAYHYPNLAWLFRSYSTFAVFSAFFSGLLVLFIFGWISMMRPGVQSFSQILNCLMWPRLLYIPLAFFSAILHFAYAGKPVFALSFIFIFFFVFELLQFLIAAFDLSKARTQPGWFYILTIGLYTAGLISLSAWIAQTSLPDILSLSMALN